MRIFTVLGRPQVRWLWGGQVFSSIGDEVYSIALVWYATSLMRTSAGYISAIQAGSIFVFGIIGGIWSDNLDHRRVMIISDVVRGLVVLALPILAHFGPLMLWAIIAVTVVVSSLSAFFNPALAALLPQLSNEPQVIQASNALMETTTRFARVIGPGVVGILSRQIPLIHYFTLDAFSFFTSAFSISRVTPEIAQGSHDQATLGLRSTILSGYRIANSHRILRYTAYSGAFAGATWIFVLPLGMTLLLREKLPANLGGLGFLISAYGVGNVTSNLAISNFHFRRPDRWIFSGRLIGGVGIFLLSFSSTLPQMMFASALTAVGGPLTDLGYINFIQKLCSGRDIARLFRYVMALGQGSLLIVYLVSPQLFQIFSVPAVIASAGIVVFLTGLFGFTLRPDKQP